MRNIVTFLLALFAAFSAASAKECEISDGHIYTGGAEPRLEMARFDGGHFDGEEVLR